MRWHTHGLVGQVVHVTWADGNRCSFLTLSHDRCVTSSAACSTCSTTPACWT